MENNITSQTRQLSYDAFISYRHCPLDQFVAINLHKKLEAFKMPKSALSLINGDKKRIERVFRDEDELPLADNLSDPIDLALKNSDFLIVICTPRLKESAWCKKEIETFLKLHDRKHILLVLAEGEPVDSFPEILTYEEVETTDAFGNKVVTRRTVEPLAADVRGKSKKEILKAMDTAVIKIAAAMFSLNYDDVKQRHREQKLKRMIALWSSVSAAIFVFAVISLIMLAKINTQKNDIQDKYAGAMAKAAQELLDSGRRNDSLYTVRSVLPNRGYTNSESYRVLNDILDPYSVTEAYTPTTVFEVSSPIRDYLVSGDGSLILINTNNNEFNLFDTQSGELLYSFSCSESDNSLPNFSFDRNSGILFSDFDGIQYLSLSDYSLKEIVPSNGYILSGKHCPDIILADNRIIGFQNGNIVYDIDLFDYDLDMDAYYEYDYCFSADENYLALVLTAGELPSLVLELDTARGELSSATLLYLKDRVQIATNGNYIYLLEDPQNSSAATLTVVDGYTSDVIGSMSLPICFVKNIIMINDNLFITSNSNALILDSYTFAIKGQLNDCGIIVNSFVQGENAMLVSRTGRVYAINDVYKFGIDITESFFSNYAKEDTAYCIYEADKYFYEFKDANYVALYEKSIATDIRMVSDHEFDYKSDIQDYMDATSVLSDLKDVELEYVYSAIYSSDNKLIFVMMYDGSLRIYNAKSKKLMKVVYSVGNVTLSSVVYIKEANIYVLNAAPYSYIFDTELNYISALYVIEGFEDGCFIIANDGNHYSVPYLSYREILDKTDKILGDYVPKDAIVEKYGIIIN